jgi:alpha,alpha-trehalase
MTAEHVQRLNARRPGAVRQESSRRAPPVAPERSSSGFLPIAAYAFLSDCRSSALVGSDGSIDWLCWPRFDSPALFSAVLDTNRGGSFRLAPFEPYAVTRRYVESTNVLQTTFRTAGGTVRVDDWLALGGSQALCRVATCLQGTVELDAQCDPRPEYGAGGPPAWTQSEGSLVAEVGSGTLVLRGLAQPQDRFRLAVGERRAIALGWNGAGPPDLLDSRREAIDAWQAWARDLVLPGVAREHALRSALVLKGLQFAPTGALVAAPTTSLPEEIGGGRNWDYRYSWVRDSSFAIHALRALGKLEEAESWFDYVTAAAQGPGAKQLQIMYGIGGEADLTESELPHLEGYERSAPVRIGNGAAAQRQLDSDGELCDAIWLHRRRTAVQLSPSRWALVRSIADRVASEWRGADRGMWEVRGEPRHFVHSKVWCWVALDRALKLARVDGRTDADTTRWRSERAAVKAEVLELGWDVRLGAFTQSYGSGSLDAANLLIAHVGFIGARDRRFVSTVRAVQRGLGRGPFVERYRVDETDDGFEDGEATFTICTLWLVLALIQIGAIDEAGTLFERVLACANDVGLLSEELTPAGDQLGNFPQAFTHTAIVACAFALEAAREASVNRPLAAAA